MSILKYVWGNIFLIHLFIISLYGCIESKTPGELQFTVQKPLTEFPEWQLAEKPKFFRSACWNSNATEGWVVGDGIIYHYLNGKWNRDTANLLLVEDHFLTSVSMHNNGSAWIVGDAIFQYSNGKWRKDIEGSKLIRDRLLQAVSVQDSNNVWAVGQGIILHYTNGNWEEDIEGSLITGLYDLSAVSILADGTGWAVGTANVLRYKDKKWTKDILGSSEATDCSPNSVIALKDGTAWAVGQGIMRYENGSWQKDTLASNLTGGKYLYSVTAQTNGSIWIAGEENMILHYDNTRWQMHTLVSKNPQPRTFFSVTNPVDEDVWAMGNNIMFHYKNGVWQEDTVALGLGEGKYFHDVTIQKNGHAWIVGEGIILKNDNNKWSKDIQGSKATEGKSLKSITMHENGTGWAVGKGIILRYQDGYWQKNEQCMSLINNTDLYEVFVHTNGTPWVMGQKIVLHYRNGIWQKHIQGSKANSIFPTSISMFPDGTIWITGRHSDFFLNKNNHLVKEMLQNVISKKIDSAWTIDKDGSVYYHNKGQWEAHSEGNFPKESFVHNIFLQPGRNAWAIINNRLYRYNNGKWELDIPGTNKLPGSMVTDIAIHLDGTGWAISSNGSIYQLTPQVIPSVAIEYSKNVFKLQDSVVFTFKHQVTYAELAIRPVDDNSSDYLKAIRDAYTVEKTNSDSTIVIKFSKHAQKALTALQGKNTQFRLRVKGHPSFDLWQEFVSNSFLVGELPLWKKIAKGAVITGGLLLLINFLFILLAIPFPWFRKNVFAPNFESLLSIFSIKGVITKPLLIWIPPIRKAILSEYRQELANKPDLMQWKKKLKIYTPPQIGNEESSITIDSLWNKINAASGPKEKNHLWLIEGRSGLGKSALLEQLTLKILEANKTPIFIKLGTYTQADSLLQKEFEIYGQLTVDANTAEEMVKNGGFYILLDGLNEARDQESVRLFVKSILRNNSVIISSQFDPAWEDIHKEKIDLKPFGKQQLQSLINDEALLQEVMKAEYLFDIYHIPIAEASNTNDLRLLPFTATLIAEYIKKNDRKIPPTRLALYKELVKELKADPQYLNLERKAWEMFIENSQNLEPDNEKDNIDLQFFQKAKDKNVMTAYTVKQETNYRFIHEKLFRFIVTSYLFKQNSTLNISELNKQLSKGQEKLYWSDVVEFWGEFLLEEANNSDAGMKKYKSFLIEIGNFEPLILKKRLIVQWNRLCGSYPDITDPEFDKKLLMILASEGKEI